MTIRGKVVARVLSRPTVLVDVAERRDLLRIGVADWLLLAKLEPGGSFSLQVEDETVVSCRRVPAH
jgi:hypothetical protein